MNIETDVVVVGGSIAGATTARLLAEAGHRIVLLDKARFPRDKPCGEGIMPTGVRLLDQLGILSRIPPTKRHLLKGVRFALESGDEVQGEFPEVGDGYAWGLGIRRLVLDQQVLDHARAHPGVDVHESETVTDISFESPRRVEVRTASRRYRARLLIGADGLHSLVRRKRGLDLSPGPRRRFGLRSHFSLARPCPDQVTVFIDSIGEFYLTPVGPTDLQVAILMEKPFMKEFAPHLETEFDRLLRSRESLRPFLEGASRNSDVLAVGPFDQWARCRVADRTLLVGDAAGYLDPITGEGISLALQGAHWAADVADRCLKRDDLTARSLMSYHLRMERALRHYKILTRLLLFLCRHPGVARQVVRRLSRCPALYTELLAINCGTRTFWNLDPVEVLRFCLPG